MSTVHTLQMGVVCIIKKKKLLDFVKKSSDLKMDPCAKRQEMSILADA